MSNAADHYLIEVGFGFTTNNNERGFSRGNYIPYQNISEFSQRRNNFSVFNSAYRYTIADPDRSTLYGDLYLDFDDENSFENVREDALRTFSYFKIVYHIPETQLQIYYSGNKGIHIIVPAKILGVEPMNMLNGVYKHIAMNMKTYSPHKTIDTKIYDNKRMFRIPNTKHEKSGLYKIPITCDELKHLSEQEIKALAQQPRYLQFQKPNTVNNIARQQFQKDIKEWMMVDATSKKDRRFKKKYDFTPPCILHILDVGAEEGSRNITIACLAGFCKNSGKSIDEAIEFIDEWNSKNTKPTGGTELRKTVRSIFNGEKQFGCQTLKGISICDEVHCPLAKKRGDQNNVNESRREANQRRSETPGVQNIRVRWS